MTNIWNLLHTWGLYVVSLILFAACTYMIVVPDKWDRATAVKICGGLLVVRQDNGSLWLLTRWRAYRVDDIEKLECSR